MRKGRTQGHVYLTRGIVSVAVAGSLIKTKKGLAYASIKTFKGLATASTKTDKGLANV